MSPASERLADSLGRAGRTDEKGKPVSVERNREMTAIDERRTAVEVVGIQTPRVIVKTPPPATDKWGNPLPVVQDDEHRGLQHLDGKAEVRPPRTWEDMEAAKRAEVGAREREALARSLHRARARLSLDERIARLQHRALTMQTQRAAQVRVTDARGAGDRDMAPQCDGHDAIGYASSDQVALDWRQIELLVERLEGYWDAHDGLEVRDVQMMSTLEKNALILGPKLRGLSPEMIHGIYGDAIGRPRTIRWVRSENGQNGRGLPKTERAERAA